MSRIDEAWTQLSRPRPHIVGIAVRAPLLADPEEESILEGYPQESAARLATETAAPLPDRTVVTPRAPERPLAPRTGTFDRRLVVNENAAPIAIEQRRLHR